MAEYLIQGETLTAIANAIREKRKSTAIFTPLQMPDEISKISGAEDMPNAEDVSFGTVDSEKEYGVYNYDWTNYDTFGNRETGMKFRANEDFAVEGFRIFYGRTANLQMTLWDAESQTELATTAHTVKESEVKAWSEGLFPSPINLEAGKSYVISTYDNNDYDGIILGGWITQCTVNPKITLLDTYRSLGDHEFPTAGSYYDCAIDIIIADTLTESVITEYKIQKKTLDNLAEAVKAQTGKVGKLTPDEMIATLQSIQLQDKSVILTNENETVTPDSNYYGLSSVDIDASQILDDASEVNF